MKNPSIYIYKGVGRMYNMDQNKLVEVINQLIINKYMQNVVIVKSRTLKLYSCFPITGAPNISDAQNIAIIEDLAKFVSTNCAPSSN
jgi:hypothetical protein